LKCFLLGDNPENKRKESFFFQKVLPSCPIASAKYSSAQKLSPKEILPASDALFV